MQDEEEFDTFNLAPPKMEEFDTIDLAPPNRPRGTFDFRTIDSQIDMLGCDDISIDSDGRSGSSNSSGSSMSRQHMSRQRRHRARLHDDSDESSGHNSTFSI